MNTNNKKLLKAILKQICEENEIDQDNVFIDSKFGYVRTINHGKKDADFCSTVYNGAKYSVQYMDGCFYPFIVEERP